MADPYIGEIRIFPFNFAPRGWAQCNGQSMAINQNTALFSLLGTTYGGDGETTFQLPNLMGRAALGPGQVPGFSDYELGQALGETAVTLRQSQMPSHTHLLQADPRDAILNQPSTTSALARSAPDIYKTPSGAATPQPLAASAVDTAGGNQPHNNLQPYLTLNFCIALVGVFPPRG